MPSLIDSSSLQALKNERQSVLTKLSQIDEAILALTGNNQEISWTYKALECIRNWDEFIQTNEILECMFCDDPVLENPQRRRSYLTALSVTLNKLCKNKTVTRVQIKGIQGYYYGLPQWVGRDGNVKNEYARKLEERINKRMTA